MHPNSVDSCLSSRSPVDADLSEHDQDQVSDSESIDLVHQDGKKLEKRNDFSQKHENQDEKTKMASGKQILSKNNSNENQISQSGTKLLEAKRARVENIVLNIKDNSTQAMDLRRSKTEPRENFENISADTTKPVRKRRINDNFDGIQNEFNSLEQPSDFKEYGVAENDDVLMTEQNELRHKRRRLNHPTHLFDSSSFQTSNNESINLSRTRNEIISQHLTSGEAYEILVGSIKQELKEVVDVIAQNSAKRVIKELKTSFFSLETLRESKLIENIESNKSPTDLRVDIEQKETEKENSKRREPPTVKKNQESSSQPHPLSLVTKQSDTPTSNESAFDPDSLLQAGVVDNKSKIADKRYDNFLHGSMKRGSPNFRSSDPNLSKSPYSNSVSPSSGSLQFPFYNPTLMSSAFMRDPLGSASFIKNPLSTASYVNPSSASSFQYPPNHLSLPLLQSLQQQTLAHALTDYGRMKNGADLDFERSSSTRTSTREPPRNPAYARIQQEPKTESIKNGNISGLDSAHIQEGLTPHHLKKAKIMFFYTRYPSANTLKVYFPDVKFTRATTSQLIKWFSNFREFFYIQIEKFARQAINEGVIETEQLHVGRESELFRVLNQHYNKCNDFRVPDEFLGVILSSLEEFFLAIQQNKDLDPSWKKPIYKVICKLDQQIPNLFKLPNVIDHLGKLSDMDSY